MPAFTCGATCERVNEMVGEVVGEAIDEVHAHVNPSFGPKPNVFIPSTLRPKSSSRKTLPYRCALLAWQNTEVSGRKNNGVAEQHEHGHHNADARGEGGGGNELSVGSQ